MMCCQSSRSKTSSLPPETKPKLPQLNSEICPLFSNDDWIALLKSPVGKCQTSVLSYNVRQNFPLQLRSAVWAWITESSRLKNVYKKLIGPPCEQIKKDIVRSGSSNCDALGNILSAYSNYDMELGYVQGMNIIAVSILEQIRQEDLAFWIFNYILNIQNYRKLFMMDMTMFQLIDKRIQYEVPLVSKLMKQFKLTAQHCFDQQFFTLFQCCRKELALRLLDVFLVEKESILITVIIKLLQLQQQEILQCSNEEELIIYIRNDLIESALDKLDDRNDLLQQLLIVIA